MTYRHEGNENLSGRGTCKEELFFLFFCLAGVLECVWLSNDAAESGGTQRGANANRTGVQGTRRAKYLSSCPGYGIQAASERRLECELSH